MNFDEMLDAVASLGEEERKTIAIAKELSKAYNKGYKDCERDREELNNGLWIPVELLLSERGDRVIVTDGVFVGEAYLNSNGKWIRYCGSLYGDGDLEELLGIKITHWMPMPVAPKKEGDNE